MCIRDRLGFRLSGDCWVERVKIATQAPPRAAPKDEPDALDIESLIAAAADDPEFAQTLAEISASIEEKLPRDLRGEIGGDAHALAALARDFLNGERA